MFIPLIINTVKMSVTSDMPTAKVILRFHIPHTVGAAEDQPTTICCVCV